MMIRLLSFLLPLWAENKEKPKSMTMKKKLTIRLALLILCAFSMNTAFAQDVRQKPVVKKQTTTTKQAPAKITQKKNPQKVNPSSKKVSTKAPTPTIGTEEDRNKPIEYMNVSVGSVSFRMVKVDGGTFTMGATLEQGSDVLDDEKPAHSVTLSTYYISETEVTQELWQEVMGSNPSYFKGSRRPVERVSWEDSQEFIRRLNQRTGKNFRLPTEAEWEYAARGGRKSYGYKYAGGSSVGDVAWYHDNSGNTTFPVAQKRANELGLYDMSGNVREWCQDYYDAYPSSSQTNPTGPSSELYRVIRGGSWYVLERYNRVSFRGTNEPSLRDNDLGLRLAL